MHSGAFFFSFQTLDIYLFILCGGRGRKCAHCLHVLRSEGNLQESVLSFHHVGPEDRTQVVRFGGKHLYLLSPLSGPEQSVLNHSTPFPFGDLGILSVILDSCPQGISLKSSPGPLGESVKVISSQVQKWSGRN